MSEDSTPAVPEAGTVETITSPTIAMLTASGRIVADEDAVAQAVQARIASRILAAAEAGDWEGVTTPTAPVGLKTLLGQELTFRSVEWLRSNIPGSAGVYAVAEVVTEEGEVVMVTTGSSTVMAQLLAYDLHGRFPVTLVPVVEKVTGRGFQPMTLRLPKVPAHR